MAKVSIIVPVYNTEKYLEEAVESLLNQKYKDIEIILINDGSTDKSLDVCKELKNIDKRIILIDQDNQGVSIARNKGIESATGKYIMFFDSDDILNKNAIDFCHERMEKYDLDELRFKLIKLKNINRYNQKNIINEISYIDEKTECLNCVLKSMSDIIPSSKKKYVPIGSCCTGIYKSSLIKQEQIRFEELEYGEDYIFNLDYITKSSKIAFTPNIFYIYRMRESSASHKLDSKKKIESQIKTSMIIEKKLDKIYYKESKIISLGYQLSAFRGMANLIITSHSSLIEKKESYKKLSNNNNLKEIALLYPIRNLSIYKRLQLNFMINTSFWKGYLLIKCNYIIKYINGIY